MSKNKVKKSKKKFYSLLLLYKILNMLNKNFYATQIARQLNISKQLVFYYICKAKKQNLIEKEFKTSYTQYKLTEKGQQFLQHLKHMLKSKKTLTISERYLNTLRFLSKKTNIDIRDIRMHNLVLKFKILKDYKLKDFKKSTEFNNWVKKYEIITYPFSITLEKTTKSIIAYFHLFETSKKTFFTDLFKYVIRAIFYIQHYLEKEYGILIDILDGEVLRQHISNKKEEFNNVVDKKLTLDIGLGRLAKGIYDCREEAKVWLDRSFNNVEIETNDLLYEENLLLMPERISELNKKMEFIINTQYEFSKNLKKHLKVLEKMNDTLDVIKNYFTYAKNKNDNGKEVSGKC